MAALNRAVIVTCVSAWEAYVEELVRESLTVLRPVALPLGPWPALNASIRGQLFLSLCLCYSGGLISARGRFRQ